MADKEIIIKINEDTQGVIINSLLTMKEQMSSEGKDVSEINQVIFEIASAPSRERKKDYER